MSENQKAIGSMLLIDRRRMRAQALTAHIMHIIEEYLCDYHGTVADKLMEAFYESGVEIITDYDRAEIGLSPRNAEGWTDEELIALEKRRLEIITRPITVSLTNPDKR